MPAQRLFLVLGLLTLPLAASVLAGWLAWVAVLGDAAALLLMWLDHRLAAGTRIAAERSWPTLLSQGGPAEVVVRLRSLTGRSVRVALRDGLHPGLAERPQRFVLELAPAAEVSWTYHITPRRRGAHLALPLTARILGPLGLAWAQRELLPAEQRRVYPQVRWEGRVGRLLTLAHRRQLGQVQLIQRGQGSEPYALREYLPGDPLGGIHWKATARHDHPVTREEVLEGGSRLLILLDCGRSMASVAGERSKLDHALAAALALARVAAARGDRVTVAAFADRPRRVVRLGSGTHALSRAYRALYDLEADLSEPAYDLAADLVTDLESRRATVLLFTSVVDLGAAELLRDALLAIGRRHHAILVNLEDAELRELALGIPERPEQAFAKVTSLQILISNRQLARRLRRGGIRVVTAPADRLTLEALEAYLELFAPRHAARRGLRRSAPSF